MEIKAELKKPYEEKDRLDFIVENNYNLGYEIKEVKEGLQAWGYTNEELTQQEKERILSLSMTRGDFFDGTIKAFGADDVDLLKPIEALLSSMPEITDIDRKVALNSYKNALNFYRKHPLFDMLSGVDIILSEAQKINITSEQWDKFFDETNKKSVDAYKALLPEESKNENTTGTDTAGPTVNEDELPQESV